MNTKLIKGIIYRVHNSGVSDKLFHILTSEGNKVSVVAKSVRNKSGKRSSLIEIGNFVEVKVLEGYNLPILTEIKVINEFREFKNDYNLIVILQVAMEIVDKFAYEGIEDSSLFINLVDLLSSKELKKSISIFILKVLSDSGHLFDINRFVDSNVEISKDDKIFYSLDAPGYLSNSEGNILLEPRIFKSQKFFLQTEFKDSVRLSLEDSEWAELLKLHIRWFEQIMDIKLKSGKLLAGIY